MTECGVGFGSDGDLFDLNATRNMQETFGRDLGQQYVGQAGPTTMLHRPVHAGPPAGLNFGHPSELKLGPNIGQCFKPVNGRNSRSKFGLNAGFEPIVTNIMGPTVGQSMLVKILHYIRVDLHLGLMLILLILKSLCSTILLKFCGGLNHKHVFFILIHRSVLGYHKFLIFMHLIFWMPHNMIPILVILTCVLLCR